MDDKVNLFFQRTRLWAMRTLEMVIEFFSYMFDIVLEFWFAVIIFLFVFFAWYMGFLS